jgi:hypothetical protein
MAAPQLVHDQPKVHVSSRTIGIRLDYFHERDDLVASVFEVSLVTFLEHPERNVKWSA